MKLAECRQALASAFWCWRREDGLPHELCLVVASFLVSSPAIAVVEVEEDPGSKDRWGGVVSANGKVYGIPLNATAVMIVDPSVPAVKMSGHYEGTEKWCGGVAAVNGAVFGIPCHTLDLLVIDPITDTITLTRDWWVNRPVQPGCMVAADDGTVLVVPAREDHVVQLDGKTGRKLRYWSLPNEVLADTTISHAQRGERKRFTTAAMGIGGKLIALPCVGDHVLSLCLHSGRIVAIPCKSPTGVSGKWLRAVASPDRCTVYGIPWQEQCILSVDVKTDVLRRLDLSALFTPLTHRTVPLIPEHWRRHFHPDSAVLAGCGLVLLRPPNACIERFADLVRGRDGRLHCPALGWSVGVDDKGILIPRSVSRYLDESTKKWLPMFRIPCVADTNGYLVTISRSPNTSGLYELLILDTTPPWVRWHDHAAE